MRDGNRPRKNPVGSSGFLLLDSPVHMDAKGDTLPWLIHNLPEKPTQKSKPVESFASSHLEINELPQIEAPDSLGGTPFPGGIVAAYANNFKLRKPVGLTFWEDFVHIDIPSFIEWLFQSVLLVVCRIRRLVASVLRQGQRGMRREASASQQAQFDPESRRLPPTQFQSS